MYTFPHLLPSIPWSVIYKRKIPNLSPRLRELRLKSTREKYYSWSSSLRGFIYNVFTILIQKPNYKFKQTSFRQTVYRKFASQITNNFQRNSTVTIIRFLGSDYHPLVRSDSRSIRNPNALPLPKPRTHQSFPEFGNMSFVETICSAT